MIKISEKFFLKLKKQENYYILRHDDESIIIGTNFLIKVHKENLGNIFQPRHDNIDTPFPLFFLITANEKNELTKDFKKRKLPIYVLSKKIMESNNEDIRQALDEFTLESFKV